MRVFLLIIHFIFLMDSIISDKNRIFSIYWNIPSFMCRKFNPYISNISLSFGVIQNKNDDFNGDKFVIFYDPGQFPAILKNGTRNLIHRNGGIPQIGNLNIHLDLFKKHVETLIPNKTFDGIAVIDFESWRPSYHLNFGVLQPYKDYSIKVEENIHPTWDKMKIQIEAARRFEVNARKFMEQTLWFAQKLRPLAKWGYYGFPHCFNSRNAETQKCSDRVNRENDNIQWLFESSDIIFPSVYLQETIPVEKRPAIVYGRVLEGIRLAKKLPKIIRPHVLAYQRFIFTDTLRYLNREDLYESLGAIKRAGANGAVLWGSSKDLNNEYADLLWHCKFQN